MTSSNAAAGTAPAKAPGGIRRRWLAMSLRKRRVIALVIAAMFLGFVGLVGAVYAAAQVPLPGDTANPQATIIEYADGSQMTTIHKENRIEIPLEQVPEHVRDAVLAAEDRGFYEHSGISFSGILRAAYQDVRGGGAKQGGSTITQQYARNAFLSQERTVARKFREAIIAVKLERQHSKDQILEWYLNTIYFGRGASGIETASRTYFGVPTKRLTVEQAAVLAALIRSPEGGDPASEPELAKKRWDGVLAGLVEMKKMTREEADRAKYPKIRPRRAAGKGGSGDGPIGHVREAVKAELKRIGFSESEIDTGGLRVRTTIDKKRQEAAVAAVHGILKDPKNDPHAALVAVEPGTGKVMAMYGGRDWGGKGSRNSFINWAVQPRQTGSAYKPFVLAAALDDGISVKSRFDGKSPQTFAGNYTVDNFDNKQFGRIDLVEATASSVNTVYVALGLEVGVDKVIDTANRMGLPDECKKNRDGSLFLGTCDQRPADMAAGFATFANKGESTGWHLVESVRSPKNKNVYKAEVEKTEALSEGEAADAIHAMRAVVERGTARAAQIGRPAAGKTGTTQDNKNALFSGFVPQLSATVWMGYEFREDDGTGQRGFPQMKNLYGHSEITGGTLPARIWQAFMSAALEGVPVEDFPPPVFGGKTTGGPTATPSASATPSETPSATPSLTITPTPTVEPTIVITPEPTQTTEAPPPSPSETVSPPPEEEPSPVASPVASGEP